MASAMSAAAAPAVRGSTLLEILRLEDLGRDEFRGVSPAHPRWARMFGGQLIALCLLAAYRTVDSNKYRAHSLHASFLRSGDDNVPVLYRVERTRQGASFAHRAVCAYQHDRCIFRMSVNFHIDEPDHGVDHQDPMPDAPPPESIPTLEQMFTSWLDSPLLHESSHRMLTSYTLRAPFPTELRRVDYSVLSERAQRRPPRQRVWVKSRSTIAATDHILHQCALAYMCDAVMIETGGMAHGLSTSLTTPQHRLSLQSLDHAMWFHQPFRADEWLLLDVNSPRAAHARVLAMGKCYRADGVLVATCAQEGLMRVLRGPTASKVTQPPAGTTKSGPPSSTSSVSSSSSSSSPSPSPPAPAAQGSSSAQQDNASSATKSVDAEAELDAEGDESSTTSTASSDRRPTSASTPVAQPAQPALTAQTAHTPASSSSLVARL